MKKAIIFSLLSVVIVFSLVLSGCQTTTGISQLQYDQVAAQLADAQSKLTKAQTDLTKAQADKAATDKELAAAKTNIADLQNQVNTLKAQTTLTGATLTETATKIVKNYNETHVYSTYDYFVCADMASEVWNMLKKQNISAVIVVGNKDTLINDILQSNHAWVLATVGPNETLALETTTGVVVKRNEGTGGLYYVGWAFKSPADLKANNDYVKEVNIRIGLGKTLNDEANKAFNAGNNALYAKLVELFTAQQTEINNLKAKIKALATQIY